MPKNCIKFKYWLLLGAIFIGYPALANTASDYLESPNISNIPWGDEVPLNIKANLDDISFSLSREEILSWISEEPSLAYVPGYFSEIENINYCAHKKSLACRLTMPYIKQTRIKKISTWKINDNLVANFVKDLARKGNRDPQDAKLKMENGKISTFSLSRPGLRLNEEKSVELFNNYLIEKKYSDSINLPFDSIAPEISTDSIENMGIKSLIGEGRSSFKGSPANRVFNIKVATNRFNGLLIKPGEEFSFVKNLGEVDGEHGYQPELVIKKDKTEPEFGGGICQVSTTAFRAAINSGLEITARRNHAYPVGYYNPQGMDATVYIPRPDLRFINNTPGYILIETKIENNELIFDFYGTSDGRRTEIIGPKILERNPDGSMKTTFTQQVFSSDGNLVKEDVFNSSYDSPDKYPHPGAIIKKPKKWSDNEWEKYKKDHGL